MLLPSSSLPANVTCEPLTVTSRRTSFRQSELRVEVPITRPCESGATTTVIVKAATFSCFEKKVPVQVPTKSVVACVVDRDGLVFSSPGLAEQTEAVPIVTPTNSSESSRTRNGKDICRHRGAPLKSNVWHQLTTRVTVVEWMRLPAFPLMIKG